jgi:hypothetical protein
VDFELNRKDLHDTRFIADDPQALAEGQALLRIESFGLTSTTSPTRCSATR